MKNTEIAKYIIAHLYDVKPSIVTIRKRLTFIEANYINTNGDLIDNKVKFKGNIAIWGMLSGRWRTHKLDGVISYKLLNKKVKITETFADGSKISKTFKT